MNLDNSFDRGKGLGYGSEEEEKHIHLRSAELLKIYMRKEEFIFSWKNYRRILQPGTK